ncbi:hypothetical protein KAU51_03640 [Candidatus Parcubacteria bacterium]|nr:hypothetical protein [Candidatus Parcubacteria bacterium]
MLTPINKRMVIMKSTKQVALGCQIKTIGFTLAISLIVMKQFVRQKNTILNQMGVIIVQTNVIQLEKY